MVHVHAQPPRLHPQHLRAPVRNRAGQPGAHPRARSATRWTRCLSAAPISARRPRRSARCRTFRELWLPYYKARQRLDSRPHGLEDVSNIPAAAWSGSIPSFIEAGFDIINPVQCSAAGMEPAGLKAKYGERLVFWGGGVDTQKTLPFGTPAEVREQVLRALRDLRAGRRFRFQLDSQYPGRTPRWRTSSAMLDAVHEFNGSGVNHMAGSGASCTTGDCRRRLQDARSPSPSRRWRSGADPDRDRDGST